MCVLLLRRVLKSFLFHEIAATQWEFAMLMKAGLELKDGNFGEFYFNSFVAT
jgi:hypothetical protein